MEKNSQSSRKRIAVFAAAGLFVAAGLALWIGRGPAPAVYEMERTVRYSLTLRNPTNVFVEDARFWAFAPVAQTAFQRVATVEASMPYTLESDDFGNQRLQFETDIPPYGSKNVSIDVHLELATEPNAIAADNSRQFLAAEEKIESGADEIVALAANLKRNSPSATADSIFNWVSTSLDYVGYVKEDRGALYALRERRGDCTEYSYLYTALARSAGLASRPIGGFVTAENAVLRARDIHNWSELYLDGKWRVVDPQNKQNRVQEHHHIAMRVLGAGGEGLTSTHQMIGADDGLEIRLN
jgi:transglutaminase-like putative cysteine protease